LPEHRLGALGRPRAGEGIRCYIGHTEPHARPQSGVHALLERPRTQSAILAAMWGFYAVMERISPRRASEGCDGNAEAFLDPW
jgi:hypothetical protein